MSSSFFRFSSLSFLFPIILLLFLCFFIVPYISSYSLISESESFDFSDSSNEFIWPTPGYTTITSPFGPRKAPTRRFFF